VVVSSGNAIGTASVQLLRRDADLGTHAKLAAIGEPTRGVHHDDGGIDLGNKNVLPPNGFRSR
jgi:uroporphyrinogen-III synthase